MIIKGGELALSGKNKTQRLDLEIIDEKITKIETNLEGDEICDATGLIIFPGAIDPHVHFNDPGYTEKEDFYHGTCAAVAGGVTTIIDMPCTSVPPVINLSALDNKLKHVREKAVVDYAFFGGVSEQAFENEFPKGMRELSSSVRGFKCYFTSGMDSFRRLKPDQLKEVLLVAKELEKPVLLHAEDYDLVTKKTETFLKKGNLPENYYKSRDEKAELLAISKASSIAKKLKARLHICHIGTAEAVEFLDGKNITGETCPHYLEFSLDDFKKLGAVLKITPPLKRKKNKEGLWKALKEKKLSFIATDHAPCPEKEKNTASIWTDYSGIPGVGTLFLYMFSEGFSKGRINLSEFLKLISENASRQYGFYDKKGSIEIGKDADLVFLNPLEKTLYNGKASFSKGKVTPFNNYSFEGRIIKTFIRGTEVFNCEQGIKVSPGFGQWLDEK